MANLMDYLDWRGDLTLAERGFNEVDNLLMAELCFLDFSGIVPADFSAPVSLPEAMQKYDAARPQETMGVLVPEQIPELGHKMAASRRFSDLTLCAYVSRTDEETQTQFSALTALLPDMTAYIAEDGGGVSGRGSRGASVAPASRGRALQGRQSRGLQRGVLRRSRAEPAHARVQ